MLVAEYFFLIACDPRSGALHWPRREQGAGQLAAAALLLDLATQERLTLRDDGRLHADEQFPLNHPLLSQALHLLAAHEPTAGAALHLLEQRLDPLPAQLLDGLFRRDLMHRIQTRDWLLGKRVRYPLRSMQARNEALGQLHAAAHGDDAHGLALLVLADMSGLLTVHLPAHEHEPAVRRLLALNTPDAQTPPARQVIAAIRAALLA
ncbi:MAG: GPP34 family phosphoprotein [Rudaea sp.]